MHFCSAARQDDLHHGDADSGDRRFDKAEGGREASGAGNNNWTNKRRSDGPRDPVQSHGGTEEVQIPMSRQSDEFYGSGISAPLRIGSGGGVLQSSGPQKVE